MLPLLAASLLAAQPAPPATAAAPGRTAWVFATIGHSEWCPAGNVRVDLRTGRYAFTPRASRRTCNREGLERPVITGRLRADRLAAVRAAAARVWTESMVHPDCRDGRYPRDRIVISNGGRRILVLANGATVLSAPDDLTCWSEAADALKASLDEPFRSAHGR